MLELGWWGFVLSIGLWVIGLVQTWWGKFKLVYSAAAGAFVLGLLPAFALFLPNDAFVDGSGEWRMGTVLLIGIAVAVAFGMLFLAALAHGIFLLKSRKKI